MEPNAHAEILRSGPPPDASFKGKMVQWGMEHMDDAFAALRLLWPIPSWGKLAMVTRYADVREVLSLSQVFVNAYDEKLDVIMGGRPFFLGMSDTEAYARDTTNMRMVVRRDDIEKRLTAATFTEAERLVAASGGQIDVVDLVRSVTFNVLCDYFGTPGPADADLRVWATRLFEFQFADQGNDPSLRKEVDLYAPLLRGYIDRLLIERRSQPPRDDVLGRCFVLQDAGSPGMTDIDIRTSLTGFIVGGLPQPPMVVPQAMEQLLRRPRWLAEAQRAARASDDRGLAALIFEALRFDPLTPGLFRTAGEDYRVAAGTWRARTIRKGTTVLAATRSAMQDGRKVSRPRTFDPTRPPYEYMHFGYGLHTCFAVHINLALIPMMLKPLLQRADLQRARGPAGHLSKKGIFSDRLEVTFTAALSSQ